MDKNLSKKGQTLCTNLILHFDASPSRYLVTVNDFFMITPFIMKTSYFSFFFIHLWCPSLCSVCMNHGRKCVSLFAQVSWETTFLQNLFPGSMEEAMKGKIWRERNYFESFVCPLLLPYIQILSSHKERSSLPKENCWFEFSQTSAQFLLLKTVYYKVSEFHFRRTIYSWEKNSPLLY